MQRMTLAALFVVAFAAPVFAATSVPAPVMPSDLATAWEKSDIGTCKKSDGTVITVTVYSKKDGSRRLDQITKNGELVALYDDMRTANTVKVKQSDGSWLNYNEDVESKISLSDIVKVTTMTPRDFLNCVDRN